MGSTFITTGFGFTVGNYLAQCFSASPNWESAFETSFAQAAALLVCYAFILRRTAR